MKEYPILMSGPLVRATIDGRKTVTRRPITIPPSAIEWCQGAPDRIEPTMYVSGPGWAAVWEHSRGSTMIGIRCPFGVVGDRLWVRETWAQGCYPPGKPFRRAAIWYRADNTTRALRWAPSIHMPRWASRLTLEITGITAERVQDITDEQARAEGLEPKGVDWPILRERAVPDPCRTYRGGFALAWHAIYGADPVKGWAANPWTWAISYRVTVP